MNLKFYSLYTNANISSLLSSLISSVCGFFSFIVLSRHLLPELFGSLVLLLSLTTTMDMVRTGLTRNAIIHYASGLTTDETRQVGATGLVLELILLCFMTILCWLALIIFPNNLSDVISAFLFWYPFIGLSNLLWNNAQSILQAREHYHKTIGLRLINTITFLIFCLWLVFTGKANLPSLIFANVLSNLLSSIYARYRNWDGLSAIKQVKKQAIIAQWLYGKYTVGSMLSSSLLKSADTYIIGLSPLLGMTGIAIYTIPFKVVEMLEIPIRSLALNAFNKISILAKASHPDEIRETFARYLLIITSIVLPMLAGILLFPELILKILGGNQYTPWLITMKSILMLIVPYALLLIYDRMLGVTLEGIGKPKLNTIKTLLMLICNIIGNLIAVFIFGSIIQVAFTTLLFTLTGIIAGHYMLPEKYRANKTNYKEQANYLTEQIKIQLHHLR